MNLKLFYLFILFNLVGLYSCESYFEDVNESPNVKTEASPADLLPAIQAELAFVVGGDISMFTSIFVQHAEGASRCGAINLYDIPASLMDEPWQNMYSGALQNLNILKALAEEEGNTQYLGIANVLLAYGWMMTTDTWGDLPYREAFKGLEITTPQYDSQEFIYEQIFELLDQAQEQLVASAAGPQPASDDLIYQGDISKWLKAAHTLEARAHLHLGKRDANRYQLALDALANGLESASDDMLLPFGLNGVNEAPWFQFNSNRFGDVQFHPVMGEFFETLNDPRLELLDQEFFRDHPILTATRRFSFINLSERKFIEAECLLQTGGDPAAIHSAYLEGIQANFEYYGLELTAEYLSQNVVDPGVGNIGLEEIILQKYLALWTAPEVFSDWRRTGLPVLIPNSGSEIPRRLLYAEKEFEGNQNTPERSQFDRVWWDIE